MDETRRQVRAEAGKKAARTRRQNLRNHPATPMRGCVQKPFAGDFRVVRMHVAMVDYAMPALSAAAWKSLCFLIRQSCDPATTNDPANESQIAACTGIKGAKAMTAAMMELRGMTPVLDGRRLVKWVRTKAMPQYVLAVESNSYILNKAVELKVPV